MKENRILNYDYKTYEYFSIEKMTSMYSQLNRDVEEYTSYDNGLHFDDE